MPTINTPVVLVVEDDPPVRGLLSDVLEGEGYEVIAVHDGSTALQVLASLQVDLITLDLDLPGLSGSELLDVLRRRKVKTPPVIVVTSTKPVQLHVREMAQLVINKPFDVDELLQGVLDLLPRRFLGAEPKLHETGAREVEHGQAPASGTGAGASAPMPELEQKRAVSEAERPRSGQLARPRRRFRGGRSFTDD